MRKREKERDGGAEASYIAEAELNSRSAERAKNKERDGVLTCPFSSRFDVMTLEDIPVFGITNTPNV